MTIRHILTINDVRYYIPNYVFEKAHKHRLPDEWITLWFYKKRQRTKIDKEFIKSDKEITSKLEYNRNTFYKMTTLSEDDDHFDYFYRLKPTVKEGNILKKNNRYTKRGRLRKNALKADVTAYGYGVPLEVDKETGKSIVHFR